MIVDGRQIAQEVYAQLPKKRAVLGVVVGEPSPVIESFVRIKEKAAQQLGIEIRRAVLEAGASTEDAIAAVQKLAEISDGIIVQLPLPAHIDTNAVLAAVPAGKDVDGISGRAVVRPPVAEAVAEILRRERIDVRGRNACVVGSGKLVGAPSAELLRALGAIVVVLEKGDSLDALAIADIVVLGAGEPGIVRPEHLKEGVVLIDAGTSESEGKVAGDADPACAERASVFTPVPGGVGPIAVAMIFQNLYRLIQ